jgi:hypothetical protein
LMRDFFRKSSETLSSFHVRTHRCASFNSEEPEEPERYSRSRLVRRARAPACARSAARQHAPGIRLAVFRHGFWASLICCLQTHAAGVATLPARHRTRRLRANREIRDNSCGLGRARRWTEALARRDFFLGSDPYRKNQAPFR